MQYKPYNVNKAIAVLITAIMFYLFLTGIRYYLVQTATTNAYKQPHYFFSFWSVFLLLLMLADIFIYRWLRKKYIIRLYANLHVLSVFIKMILLPILAFLFMLLLPYYASPGAVITIGTNFSQIALWAGMVILLAGHVFLAIVIIHRNRWPLQENETAAGYLTEFDR
jgi:hypothetical protein